MQMVALVNAVMALPVGAAGAATTQEQRQSPALKAVRIPDVLEWQLYCHPNTCVTSAFHNLPPGSYRVLAYRTGSRFRISEPIVLKSGEPARLDIVLPETVPPGNLVQNPDGR